MSDEAGVSENNIINLFPIFFSTRNNIILTLGATPPGRYAAQPPARFCGVMLSK